MKLHLYEYHCSACDHVFSSPQLAGDNYGLFLMRSRKKNYLAYVNAITDSVYDEVENFLKDINYYAKLNKIDRARLLQRVFGYACDVAPDDSIYIINLEPTCKNCGEKNKIKDWNASDPPIYLEKDISHVTHTKWNSLQLVDREGLIQSALSHEK